ncbi:hypothetical protein DFA_11101 [Cavenderia fasciculata]|uniref:Uncharacterized protein n=1 Tax=Cavenderia fasciculata TaxID=261658 RepID=F4QES9_CACFS|nr:uncharacterized protein DFA_11101 [Cavenderia fasciculata]EGG13340.1 hypothetical protein DFA_11101 [Cavenderia fasciculata]|eukprot:XP_004350044.1 hypothetical protein DFA_11101 [Cavenderia fasciculata]
MDGCLLDFLWKELSLCLSVSVDLMVVQGGSLFSSSCYSIIIATRDLSSR